MKTARLPRKRKKQVKDIIGLCRVARHASGRRRVTNSTGFLIEKQFLTGKELEAWLKSRSYHE